MLPPPWKVYHFLWFVVTKGQVQTQVAFHPVDLACFEVKSLVAGRLIVIEECFCNIVSLVNIELLLFNKNKTYDF